MPVDDFSAEFALPGISASYSFKDIPAKSSSKVQTVSNGIPAARIAASYTSLEDGRRKTYPFPESAKFHESIFKFPVFPLIARHPTRLYTYALEASRQLGLRESYALFTKYTSIDKLWSTESERLWMHDHEIITGNLRGRELALAEVRQLFGIFGMAVVKQAAMMSSLNENSVRKIVEDGIVLSEREKKRMLDMKYITFSQMKEAEVASTNESPTAVKKEKDEGGYESNIKKSQKPLEKPQDDKSGTARKSSSEDSSDIEPQEPLSTGKGKRKPGRPGVSPSHARLSPHESNKNYSTRAYGEHKVLCSGSDELFSDGDQSESSTSSNEDEVYSNKRMPSTATATRRRGRPPKYIKSNVDLDEASDDIYVGKPKKVMRPTISVSLTESEDQDIEDHQEDDEEKDELKVESDQIRTSVPPPTNIPTQDTLIDRMEKSFISTNTDILELGRRRYSFIRSVLNGAFVPRKSVHCNKKKCINEVEGAIYPIAILPGQYQDRLPIDTLL